MTHLAKLTEFKWLQQRFRSLRQRSRPILVYIVDFHQLTSDVDWNDNALISAFPWRLRHDPLTLTEAII
jgi:hypothetical protein